MSRRAEIFKQLLPFISAGRYEHVNGEYWIFGKTEVELLDDLQIPSFDSQHNSLLGDVTALIGDLAVHQGRVESNGRLDLEQTPEMLQSPLADRSPDRRAAVAAALKRVQETMPTAVSDPLSKEAVSKREDHLDAKLATEFLGRLPKAVRLASALDKLEVAGVSNEAKRYFREAHHCYLLGLPIACAVLCRALLESSLQKCIDADGLLKASLVRKSSYIGSLLDEAVQRKILTEDRRRAGKTVRDAGNDAIHAPENFKLAKIGEVLDCTRKVLIDLYAPRST